MRHLIKNLTEPISDVVFPPVCACCGDRLIDRKQMICVDCLHARFEPAQSDDELLPHSVAFRLSLWSFDKYGYLQHLLHKLKYDHCTGVGEQLGREAGRLLLDMEFIKLKNDWRILAVPLHKKRFRTRGYNQSMEIAKGVACTTGIQLLTEDVVTRVKQTKTQTGLNSSERNSNISGAFNIISEPAVRDRKLVLVDDVFTTGATTFELARTLKVASGYPCGILTIAKA